MDTPVEGSLALRTNPIIIRLLRFKARYGFRLSDSLEAAMRSNAKDYAQSIEPLEVENQLRRMWFGGYAADCFDVLMDYDLFGYFHPPVADICHTEAYQAYAHKALERLDADKAVRKDRGRKRGGGTAALPCGAEAGGNHAGGDGHQGRAGSGGNRLRMVDGHP